MRLGMPRTYCEYVPPRGWAGVRLRFRRMYSGLTAPWRVRRRFARARRPLRTDDPMVGRGARWLGIPDMPPSMSAHRIPVGTVGRVASWIDSDGRREYVIEFDFPDGEGGVDYYAALPDRAIELV